MTTKTAKAGFTKFAPMRMTLASGTLELRPMRRSDVSSFNKILNEPYVTKYLLVTTPVAPASTLSHFSGVSRNPAICWVAAVLAGKLAGAIEWRKGRLKKAHVTGFNIIFSSKSQGTGAATAAFLACLPFLRRNGVEIISDDCFADNLRARSFYKKLGFTEPAVLKKRFKHNGKYYDEVLIEKKL